MLSTSSIASWSVETLLHELFFTCFASFYYLFIHSILFHYIHAFIWIPCALLIILDNLYARVEPKGDKGGHLPPLTPKISLHMYSTLVTPWHREKRKKKKKDPLESDTGKRKEKEVTLKDQSTYLFTNFTILISSFWCPVLHLFDYFLFIYLISLFSQFSLWYLSKHFIIEWC